GVPFWGDEGEMAKQYRGISARVRRKGHHVHHADEDFYVGIVDAVELVRKHWNDAGVDTRVKAAENFYFQSTVESNTPSTSEILAIRTSSSIPVASSRHFRRVPIGRCCRIGGTSTTPATRKRRWNRCAGKWSCIGMSSRLRQRRKPSTRSCARSCRSRRKSLGRSAS